MQEKKSKNFKIKKVNIVGVITSYAFQRAKYCALELHKKLPMKFPQPQILGLLELDWNEKLIEWRQTIGREYWCLRRPVAVFFDGKFIGSDIELIKLVSIGNILLENIPRKNSAFLKENFKKDYISYLTKSKRVYCYLDICVDELFIGTLTFQLYCDVVPRTCQNFESLCLGTRGPLLSYKGSQIHRIVKEGWLQGGDIQYKTGGGGFSIFCDPFEDEGFGISHDRRGILSMANHGRNTNASQFFITLKPSKWMDMQYVAFGRLIEGVYVLKVLENLETFYEKPLKKVEIKNCGKLDLEESHEKVTEKKEKRGKPQRLQRFETISEQIMRLILEAVTDALARKEHIADVLDDGDVPSKMNIQLYFQGFYSIPEKILENTAKYLRKIRRELFRELRPSATQIVETITYDLLMGIFSRMITLDEIKDTIGSDLYRTMLEGIDMNFELCKKPYLKRMIDQIITSAESMIGLIIKKLMRMKRMSVELQKFKQQMQDWVQSFVLQETFKGDKYHIALRPGWEDLLEVITGNNEEKTPVKEVKEVSSRIGTPCCEEGEKEKKKKEKMLIEKMKKKYAPEDICCIGSKIFKISEIKLSDYFKTCRYELKKIPKPDKERMPILDLIEYNRYQLKYMRKQENRVKTKSRICMENKIRKWMDEVAYTSETLWIRDLVFERDDMVFDHMEEIMYGAMTAGLLEMYYFMEQYLKMCGKNKEKLVTKTLHPYQPKHHKVSLGITKQSTTVTEITGTMTESEDYKEEEEEEEDTSFTAAESKGKEGEGEGEERENYKGKEGSEKQKEIKGEETFKDELTKNEDEEKQSEEKAPSEEDEKPSANEEPENEKIEEEIKEKKEEKPPCLCGHPCCVCKFDPFYKAPAPPPSLAEEEGEEKEKEEEGEIEGEIEKDLEKEGEREIEAGKEEKKEKMKVKEKEKEKEKIKEEEVETVSKKKGSDEHPQTLAESTTQKDKPCRSDETLVDLNAILAEKTSLHPEEIDIKSFYWLKPYILEEGCDLKTEFATNIHKWLEGERIDVTVFTSKQSLATRASILSLSLSLAELIKDENKMKKDIRNFIYDLWDLYFKEMFKEALLEFPPEESEIKKGEKTDNKNEYLGNEGSEETKEEAKEETYEERRRTLVSILSDKKRGEEKLLHANFVSNWMKENDDIEDTRRHTIVSIIDERTKKKESDDDRKLSTKFSEIEEGKHKRKPMKEVEDLRKSLENQIEAKERSSQSTEKRKSRESELTDGKKSRGSESTDGKKSRGSQSTDGKKSRGSQLTDEKKSRASELTDGKKSGGSEIEEKEKSRGSQSTDRKKSGERESEEKERSRGSQTTDKKKSRESELEEKEKSRDSQSTDRKKSKGSDSEDEEKIKNEEYDTRRKSRDAKTEDKKKIREIRMKRRREKENADEEQYSRRESRADSRKNRFDTLTLSSKTLTSHSVKSHSEYGTISSTISPEVSQSKKNSEELLSPNAISGTLSQHISGSKDLQSDFSSRRSHEFSHGSNTRRSTRILEDIGSLASGEGNRSSKHYTSPFWIKFLTELTKQALGSLAKISRLPRRLYFRSDSEVNFDDKMQEWFEFNAFNPQPTKGRELMDFIAAHHKSLTNLDDSVRGYLKKKKYSELICRCSRITSADDMANNIIANALDNMISPEDEPKTLELYVSNMLVGAAASSPQKSDFSLRKEGDVETDAEEHSEEESNDENEPDSDSVAENLSFV